MSDETWWDYPDPEDIQECDCGRLYNAAVYSSCYDCYIERRGDYVTCIECGVRWHDPFYAMCYVCSHSGPWRERFKRQEAAIVKRLEIMMRDQYICQICKKTSATQIDHIKPCRAGGNAMPWNLQAVCAQCNRIKSDTWWPGCKWEDRRTDLMGDYFLSLRHLLTDDERAVLKQDVEDWRRQRGFTDPVRSL